MKLSNEQENWLKFRINKQNEQKEKDLRDYFAAMAMQGLISTCRNESYESTAIVAYRMADAMLKERENESNN